ncbi:TPA: hypothetical protein ACX6QG_002620 [Photobacterium damselae]
MIHYLIYKVGVLIRNRRIFVHQKRLDEEYSLTHKQLTILQEEKLKKLLKIAQDKSPYYKDKLKNIDISTFTLNDLNRLPILSKSELRDNIENISINDGGKSFVSETSGTSGNPLVFSRCADWDAAHRAAITRGLALHGIKPWDRSLYLWGFIFSPLKKIKTRVLDWLQNRYRIFSYKNESISEVNTILKKVKYIEGYSSVVNQIAMNVINGNERFPNIQAVKCTSEKIFPSYHANIRKAFGVSLISEYGAAETGIIAFSCKEGKMHVIEENIILENIDGKAIVTNLYSFNMPVIRYELGDFITVSNGKCKCGRHTLIVDEVTGRIGKDIQGYNYNYPSLYLYYIFKNLALNYNLEFSYQVIQKEKGKLKFVIFDEQEEKYYIDCLSKSIELFLKDDIDYDISFELSRLNEEKLKDFVSYL